MPGYRFTTFDGKRVDFGDEPLPFRDDHAASDAAQKALVNMADDALPNGKAVDLTASVDNDDGERIYEASLTFRAKTADDMKAEQARKDGDGENAAEAIARALNNFEAPKS
ncbi:MAG: hypothetical protein EOO23_02680 [Comamonadaceae bacterium]|nr:MAG: hypothetical protein EOO23_02680 [Comamonadaceae bacterium]